MDCSDLLLTPAGTGVRITLQVQPGAPRDMVAGVHNGALKVRIAAPPVGGAANERCRKFLAKKLLLCSVARVTLISGMRSRRKLFLVEGMSTEDVRERLSHLPGST